MRERARRTPQPSRSPIAIGIAVVIAVVLIVWSGLDGGGPRLTPADRTATAAAGVEPVGGLLVRFLDGAAPVPGGCFSVETDWGFDAVCDGDAADRAPAPGEVAMPFFGPDDPGAADPAARLILYPPTGFALQGDAAIVVAFARAGLATVEARVAPQPASPIASAA